MKQGSTIFLRVAVLAMGLVVLAACALVLPAIYREWAGEFPEIAYLRFVVLFVLGATTIPFFIALFQTWKLLGFIDKNKAFSPLSVKALGIIKYCALIISGFYAAGMPLVYYVADQEDAPGLILFGLFFVFAPAVITVFAAVLQKLLQNAIDIQSENDLTV